MRLAECLVGDETGIVVFAATNDQVDAMKEGSTVILRNAKIDMYKGSMRLAVDKWGRVERAVYLQLTNGVHVYTGVLSWVRRLWALISSRTKEQCVGISY
ncbi:hypothetical protein M8C21_017166 [Ambrosia artemisiifolia]|uniref:Single-stranded DNA binding protein Ssb-like OB fold domain-containing protein n=1 Tax=Ambrosia artemisiifolia TaxID=4212 RepID=A0AAD5GL78_AMBAR|nr:hypothetical protein M8C21_017166 [Ambrosia artemisiifolia]